jgi:hypothetical protein
LNQLEEERAGLGTVEDLGRIFEEDLKQVGTGPGAVDQDPELRELARVFVDAVETELAQVLGQTFVVAGRRRHQLDASLP